MDCRDGSVDMAIPDDIRTSAETILLGFCQRSWPRQGSVRSVLTFSVRGDGITLSEKTATDWGRNGTFPIARFKYADGLWSLWQADRNGKWLAYMDAQPSANLTLLLQVVVDDPFGVFGLR